MQLQPQDSSYFMEFDFSLTCVDSTYLLCVVQDPGDARGEAEPPLQILLRYSRGNHQSGQADRTLRSGKEDFNGFRAVYADPEL